MWAQCETSSRTLTPQHVVNDRPELGAGGVDGGGEVVHHGNVDKLLRIVDHLQYGIQVLLPPAGTEGWGELLR